MKKLFAILMSIMMIACLMPIMAFADAIGSEITITINTLPIPSAAVTTVDATTSSNVDITFLEWKEKGETTEIKNFEAGKTYTAKLTITAKGDDTIGESATAKLEGENSGSITDKQVVGEDSKSITYTYEYAIPAAYNGNAVATPELGSKAGGSVTLKAVTAPSEETIEYGYSQTKEVNGVAHWQVGTTFNDLTAGGYYFFARVKAKANSHSGGGVSAASDLITVYAKPTIAYSASIENLIFGTTIKTITPTVTGGAQGDRTYALAEETTLPSGLELDANTGTISGTPDMRGEAGSVKITVTDAENITSEPCTVQYSAVSAKELKDVTIANIGAQEYTGTEIKPEVTVTSEAAGTPLTKGTDYTVEYSKNTNAGQATVTVKPVENGNYTFTEVKKEFTITPKNAKISITGVTKTYDKTPVTTENITVSKDKDDSRAATYEFYANKKSEDNEDVKGDKLNSAPVDAGIYWVQAILTEAENYAAAESEPYKFRIEKADITPKVTLEGWAYGEDANDPTVEGNTGKATPKFEYKVQGDDDTPYSAAVPTAAGNYTVRATIPATENYNGATVTKDFTITAKALTQDMIAAIPAQSFTGGEIKPEPIVTDGGKTLVKGTDFTYSYKSNTNAGNAQVTITGTGNYQGIATKDFTINKAAAVSIPTQHILVKKDNVALQEVKLEDLMPKNAGAVTYADPQTKGSLIDTADENSNKVEGNKYYKFKLASDAPVGSQTVTIKISSANYADSTVTIVIDVTDKKIPTVTVSPITIQYTGKALGADSIKGTAKFGESESEVPVEGSFDWKDPAPTNVADSGKYNVVFTPKSNEYASVTTAVQVTIQKATSYTGEKTYAVTAKKGAKETCDVKTLLGLPADAVLTYVSATEGNAGKAVLDGTPSINADGKLIFAIKADAAVKGTVAIKLTVKSANYTDFEAILNVTVAQKSSDSSSGGGSYYPYTPSTPSKPAAPNLDKTKTDSTTALNAAATANKYDAAEQAEVKKILDKANADIKNAKTEAEVKAIEEAAQAEIDKILTTEEKAIVAALDNVEKRDFATKSKVITRKGGKKVIRLTWTAPDGVDVDGYEIFRSTKKNSGFGKKPYFTTSNTSYTNTKDLKAGKTYYYKVRAFVVINGERVYTDYSLKAYRKL